MKPHNISTRSPWVAFILVMSAATGIAGVPFDSAMVTRVENKVTVGEVQGGQVADRRPAAISDVIKAENFVQTTSNSRAELQFRDKSLVRVGQNSVFSFQSGTRTLSLERGEMLFYVVPGKGGATIKTPTLTAAITGSVALVRRDRIIMMEGSLKLKDENGKTITIEAGGEFNAVKFVDGKLVPYHEDIQTLDLSLYTWAPLPADAEKRIAEANPGWVRRWLESLEGDDYGGAAIGLTSLTNPIFGGAGTGFSEPTTNVNPPGPVPMIDKVVVPDPIPPVEMEEIPVEG